MEPKAVLRYWLGAVRYEEALLARPRAHRPGTDRAVDLAAPGVGQAYFRLGSEHADFFLLEQERTALDLDGGALRFLEHTLRKRYRSEARRERTFEPWLAGWPVLYFAGREELAPLFRFPIDVSWRIGEAPWSPPSADARRSGAPASLPSAILLEHGGPALSLDSSLANRELGILEEDLAELAARWERARPPAAQMVRDLLSLLEPDAPRLAGRELFAALGRAAASRARAGTSVHAVGIIQDASVSAPTHHLQRELAALIADEVSIGSPLSAYLTGQAAGPSGWSPLMGRRHARGLTECQRAAAECFLGSTLTAVQGPPGTGKTELILDLAAHAVAARAECFERTGIMTEGLLVVSSTNNRAVDNVLDPLSDRSRLPIGLRAGNQEVTSTATVEGLAAAREWLASQPDQDAKARLEAALVELRSARARWEGAVRPECERRRRSAKHATVLAELQAFVEQRPLSKEERALMASCERLLEVLDAMSELSIGGGRKLVRRLERRWTRDGARSLVALRARDADLGGAIALPPAKATIDAWTEAVEDAQDLVERAVLPLRSRAGADRGRARKQRLEVELLALESMGDDRVDAQELEAAAHSLYLSALDVREAWAVSNKTALMEALDASISICSEHRSLRRALSDDKTKRWLRSLFPVIGSTLLSLGNVFSIAHRIRTLVIDEAGQCHPAHAVAGLMRAERALIIGDVHQLPPVIQLSPADEERVLRRASREQAKRAESLEPYRVGASFTTSAQALADRAVDRRHELVDHFRCQAEIIGICDRLCGYQLRIHTPPRSLAAPILSAPVLFAAIAGKQQPQHGSWYNRHEVEAVSSLVDTLTASGIAWHELAILTPYVAQLEEIRRALRRSRIPTQEDAGEGVATGTIHRFQGGERSLVILSTVVTEARSLRFLDERAHLLNVAVSRARDHLIVLGHGPTLLGGARTRVVVEAARELSGRPVAVRSQE